MVIIVSTFGATKNYPEQQMMRHTLEAFIRSLINQTDEDWRLFISCHDAPDVPGADDSRIIWSSVRENDLCDETRIPKIIPGRLSEDIEYEAQPYECKITDMSRKTLNSVIEAGQWAFRNKIDNFWMLRMDSDDLLACNVVEMLNEFDAKAVRAVYSRICHMLDVKSGEIAIHRYPYSITCNALFYERENDLLRPDWFYHCHDHTTFWTSVAKDRIPAKEVDYMLCIVTNSGNSISGRPELSKEKNVQIIPMTEDLLKRYGLLCLKT